MGIMFFNTRYRIIYTAINKTRTFRSFASETNLRRAVSNKFEIVVPVEAVCFKKHRFQNVAGP